MDPNHRNYGHLRATIAFRLEWAEAELNRRHTDFQSAITPAPIYPNQLIDKELGPNTQKGTVPRAAECAAFPTNDRELSVIAAAWSRLPEAIRARILGLVEGATATGAEG